VTAAIHANSIPVAEYTLATILLSLKHAWSLARQTRERRTFVPRNGAPSAFGSTVGLISLGNLGRTLVDLLRTFHLRILAYDPHLPAAAAKRMGVELVSLAEVFRRSDVVSLRAPHTAETEGMVTGAHLASMATFINTARGAVVRERELVEVLGRRPDLQAVLDVTDPEPPVRDSPLYTLPNVVLTPHIAGSAGGECRRMGRYMVEELERYVAGEPLEGRSRPRGRRPRRRCRAEPRGLPGACTPPPPPPPPRSGCEDGVRCLQPLFRWMVRRRTGRGRVGPR
jgi:phosphoglycerate dehydrogenase-like enzyme